MTEISAAGLGCAAHSGWAVVVGVSLVGGRCRVVVRERIEMIDPADPGSKQPYHTVEGLPIEAAAGQLAKYSAVAERMASETVGRIAGQLRGRGHQSVGLGILESAGRKGGSLAAVLRSHALIHTADGDHFRNALALGASRAGLPVTRVPARELEERAAGGIGEPISRLKAALKRAGAEVGPPWGADQKAAALLAWLVVAAAERRASG